jgi:hypothetical protein
MSLKPTSQLLNVLPFQLHVIDGLHRAQPSRINLRLSQDITRILWKPELHCRVISIMGHINPFHALWFYLFKIHLSIILQSSAVNSNSKSLIGWP